MAATSTCIYFLGDVNVTHAVGYFGYPNHHMKESDVFSILVSPLCKCWYAIEVSKYTGLHLRRVGGKGGGIQPPLPESHAPSVELVNTGEVWEQD